MKTGRLLWIWVALATSFLVVFGFGGYSVYGQARTTARSEREPVLGGDGLPIKLKIRSVEGLGSKNYVETPVYTTSAFRKRSKGNTDWVNIVTEYSTDNEWIDELTFSYFVLTRVQGSKGNAYSLYRANVTYVDIAKDREHYSTMFIRPNAVERYGDPVAIAVIVSVQGKELDVESVTGQSMPERWWDSPAVLKNPNVPVTVRDGYLLNRSQSPWVYINIDEYEAIRQ